MDVNEHVRIPSKR